jgi:acyl-CoA dehydrogenase
VHSRAVARIEFARHAPMPGKDGGFSSADVGVSR